MPTEAALSNGAGEKVDKYPNSLVLQLKNSECCPFSPSPPKGLCSSHPYLDNTLCISFLPSVSCLPIPLPSIPWSPLLHELLASKSMSQVCSWENLNQDIYFFLVFSCNYSFIPTFWLFFQGRGRITCHLVLSITYDRVFLNCGKINIK